MPNFVGAATKRWTRVLRLTGGLPKGEIFSQLIEMIKKVCPHSAMCAVKTMLAAWTTHDRLHDAGPSPGCVFGCTAGADGLRYYAECPKMTV